MSGTFIHITWLLFLQLYERVDVNIFLYPSVLSMVKICILHGKNETQIDYRIYLKSLRNW